MSEEEENPILKLARIVARDHGEEKAQAFLNSVAKYVIFSPDERRKGLHIVAGRGSGKSTLIGWDLAFGDVMNAIPLVLLDDGDSIDLLIDKCSVAKIEAIWY